jgi:hypothetical protein
MSNTSTRACSLFSNASKRDGGTYYSGKTQATITIPAGARVTLVKSSKLASNGSEIWSLLFDAPGAADDRRVYESRGDVDMDNFRGEQMPAHFERDTDTPF